MEKFSAVTLREKAIEFYNTTNEDCEETLDIIKEFLLFCGVPLFQVILVRDKMIKAGGTITKQVTHHLTKEAAQQYAKTEMEASKDWPVGEWTSYEIIEM